MIFGLIPILERANSKLGCWERDVLDFLALLFARVKGDIPSEKIKATQHDTVTGVALRSGLPKTTGRKSWTRNSAPMWNFGLITRRDLGITRL